MSTVRQIIVDGISVPVYASISISQTYEELRATSRRRFLGGGAWQRTTWSGKLRTSLSGNGVIPYGLSNVDFTSSFEISCKAPRSINGSGRVFTLPAARRSDAGSEPYGRALVGDTWVDTPCNVVGDTATLDAVSGATQYQVVYFPKLTVVADAPNESHPNHGPDYSWSIVAEEV